MNARRDVYVSLDVETDGDIPGDFSMLSVGMCVCATRAEGDELVVLDPIERTLYLELQPISERFDAKALAVSGLDRDELVRTGTPPLEAASRINAWLNEQAAELDGRIVIVAFPLGFDWMFVYWYLRHFDRAGAALGHSDHLDMKSIYQAKADVILRRATKRRMPKHLLSDRPHTHNALDDAIEQADLFCALARWDGRTGPSS